MFHGYFAREYPSTQVSQVCYYDSNGVNVIQEYYRDEPKAGTTRKAHYKTVADPIEEGRRLVAMLNGGRDFAKIADELRAMRVMIDEHLGRIANKIDPTR